MAGTVEQKLAAQGVVVHEPASPVANYVGFVRTGNLLFVSGQVCVSPEGKLIARGKLGAGVTVEQGAAAARGCAINLLAQIKAALGDLDKVVRVVRLGGFVNSAPDFLDGLLLQIEQINHKSLRGFQRIHKMLDKLARRKTLVGRQVVGRRGEIANHRRLFFAEIGFTQFRPRFLRLDLVEAGVDRDARDPMLERHLAGKLRQLL